MKNNKALNKVKKAESTLDSNEMKMDQEALEKYRKMMSEIDTEISKLKEAQEEMNKKII